MSSRSCVVSQDPDTPAVAAKARAPAKEDPAPRMLLVGNPNVGKSVIFGLLTGRYVVVSNYPGTTVEVARGETRLGGRKVEVIDTPGANSLSPNSEDERVARDVVLAPGAKTVIQVADAKNLRRALFLTAQLAELEIPMVLALNMSDEAQDRGITIDVAGLEKALGIPVVPMVATERRGLRRLLAAAGKKARPARFRPEYGEAIEEAARELEALLPSHDGRRGRSLMFLAGDGEPMTRLPGFEKGLEGSAREVRERLASRTAGPAALAIQRGRAALADELVGRVVTRIRSRVGASGISRALFFFALLPTLFYSVGWILASVALYGTLPEGAETGSIAGIVRWLLLLGPARFEALGGLWSALLSHGAGFLTAALYCASAWRREYAGGAPAAGALARLSTHPVGGFPLLFFVLWVLYRVVGVFAAGDCVDFLESSFFGTYDETTGAFGGLVNGPFSRALAWLVGKESTTYAFFFAENAGLVSTGLTYAIAIVLPIVTFFFLAFALMEDSGYLPRLALMADRIFKRVGLSGKAVLPMVLGLGCGAMATMTTRVLETRRQRMIAILLLALAVPCSAQLGIITSVLADISAKSSAAAVLLYIAVVLGVLFAVGWAASKVMSGGAADLLIEVPPLRSPSLRNVVVKTYHRVKWFMREAVPLFLIGTVFVFVAERIRLLKLIEYLARPLVVGLLGLPVKTTLGFVMGFLRRDYGAIIIFDQFRDGDIGPGQALVALVVITLFVPCIAHFFVCVKEIGWRKALMMNAFIFALAFLVGGVVRAIVALTGIA